MDIPVELVDLLREFGQYGFWLIIVYLVLEYSKFPIVFATLYMIFKPVFKFIAEQIREGNL